MGVLICTVCGKEWKTGIVLPPRNCPVCKGLLAPKASVENPPATSHPADGAHGGWSPVWTAVLIGLAFLIVGGIVITGIVASNRGPQATSFAAPVATTQADMTVPDWDLPDSLRKPVSPKPPIVLTPAELFAAASPAVVRVVVRDGDLKVLGLGSGFFVSADGLLVTNFHVIKGASFASVLMSDSSTLFVDGIAASDETNDLALLKINGTKLNFLTIAPDTAPPVVGTKVYAIGNPKGLTNTFSEGMISGVRQEGNVDKIQTTAPISPGSSGGPLIDNEGRVVGVTSSYLASGQNLNFAIPARRVAQLLKNRGKLVALTSANGTPLAKEATAELDKVWEAIDRADWRVALSILTKIRPEFGDSPSYWFAMGYLHLKMDNPDMAVDAFKQCLKLLPNDAIVYGNLGNAYFDQQKYAEAIAAYKSALAIQPDSAMAYNSMGKVYFKQKKYALAMDAYKSALAIQPDYASAYNNMGNAYFDQQKDSEAIAAYKKAAALDPNGQDGQYAKKMIDILNKP